MTLSKEDLKFVNGQFLPAPKPKKKKVKKIISIFLALLMVFQIFAVPTEAAAVALNKTKATIYVGSSKTLKLTGTKKSIKWTSSKKSVATVSAKGKVTAKQVGKATITAKVGKKSYQCKVTVKEPYLNKTKKTLKTGVSFTIKITGTTAKKWSSNKAAVASVNSKGKVTAKKAGTATITCLGKNGKSYQCKITVKTATTISPSDPHTHTYNDGVVTKAATSSAAGVMKYTCKLCGETITKEYGLKQTFTNRNRTADLYGYWDAAEAKKILKSINQYRKSKGYSELTLKSEYTEYGKKQVEAVYFGISDFSITTESGIFPRYICAAAQPAYSGEEYFKHYIQGPGNDGISNSSLFEREDIEVAIAHFTEIKYGNFQTSSTHSTFTNQYTENRESYYIAVCIYEK